MCAGPSRASPSCCSPSTAHSTVLHWPLGRPVSHCEPGSQDSALSHCQPHPPPRTPPPRLCHLRLERRRGAQTTLAYLGDIFLGRAFLMVVGFRTEITEPHVRIAEKNLKPHRNAARYSSRAPPTHTEAWPLFWPRWTRQSGSHPEDPVEDYAKVPWKQRKGTPPRLGRRLVVRGFPPKVGMRWGPPGHLRH